MTSQEIVSDGSLVGWTLSLEFFSRTEITLKFDGVAIAPGVGVWNWSGPTGSTIVFSPAVASGVKVVASRVTDASAMHHDFESGAQFLTKTLDENFLQLLRLAQEYQASLGGDPAELFDERYLGTRAEDPTVNSAGNPLTQGNIYSNTADGSLRLYIGGVWVNAVGTSLPAAVAAAQDAADGAQATANLAAPLALLAGGTGYTLISGGVVRLTALLAAAGSTLVGYIAAGTGAVLRTLQDKLRERVSVKDFGAVGDGTNDDTAAIQAAVNSGAGSVYFPDGVYKITNTITFSTLQSLYGTSSRKVRVVMTDTTKFAFKAVGVPDTGTEFRPAGDNYSHGSFKRIDVRARYGLSINSVNTANAPSYDYANPTAFFAANVAVLGFRVSECMFVEDVLYANGATWLAAQPTYNTLTVPTLQQLYTAGIGVLFSNVYEGIVEDTTFLYFGCGVLLYGSDISEVRNCRFGTNLRHGWSHCGAQSPSGFQNTWHHNDCLYNYSMGGFTLDGGFHTVSNNYFENTGAAGASTINSYVYDYGFGTTIVNNRFDDYGSTKTSGPLMNLAGTGSGIVSQNKLNDNRPAGAGTVPRASRSLRIPSPA